MGTLVAANIITSKMRFFYIYDSITVNVRWSGDNFDFQPQT